MRRKTWSFLHLLTTTHFSSVLLFTARHYSWYIALAVAQAVPEKRAHIHECIFARLRNSQQGIELESSSVAQTHVARIATFGRRLPPLRRGGREEEREHANV